MDLPAPLGNVWQQYPCRLPHRAREMSHACVYRNDQVDIFNERGGVGKIRKLVTVEGNPAIGFNVGAVMWAQDLLKAHPFAPIID